MLDATNPDALAEADITAFKTVVIAISDDFETNGLITSTLQSMGIPNIICLAGSSRHQEILLRIGANRDVLGEVCVKRLNNPNLGAVFPGYSVKMGEILKPR